MTGHATPWDMICFSDHIWASGRFLPPTFLYTGEGLHLQYAEASSLSAVGL